MTEHDRLAEYVLLTARVHGQRLDFEVGNAHRSGKGNSMNIFQRVITFDGPPQEVMPWAMEVTEMVNDRTSLNVSLWQGQFGLPLGTLAWSTLLDNLTALEAANESLMGDPAYIDLVSKARDWVSTPGEDRLVRVQHTTGGEYQRPEVGAYAEATAAVPAEGKLIEASTFGVEISELHSKLTHASVLFCTSAYGNFGEMVWLGLYESATAVDAAAEAVSKDPEYGAKIDAAGGLFVPGMATRSLARRIA